jgi:hypothetical protein
MNGIYRTFSLDVHNFLHAIINRFFGIFKFGQIGAETRNLNLIREIILNGIRKNEISISQALHQSRSAQTIGSVIGKVGFPNTEKTFYGSLQLVIYPNSTHCVMNGRINHHGSFVRIVVHNFLVHLEKISISFLDDIDPQT